MKNSQNIVDIIDKVAYPSDVVKTIKILSLNKEEPAHIFGSYSYKNQKFGADVDLLETDIETNSIDNAVNQLEKKLLNIFENVSGLPDYYLSEFKAGLDTRYDVDIGTLERGKFTRSNPVLFMQKIMLLSGQNLLDKEEVDELFNIYNKKQNELTKDDYDVAFNILRNHRILRWSMNDILDRRIALRGGGLMTLNDALYYNTQIKIDMITYLNARYVEVTNFIIFVLLKDGEMIVLNDKQNAISDIKTNTIEGLQKEIDKVFFSNMFFNPFKGIKRLWSLGRQYGDFTMLNFLQSIISGDISRLYQKKSDIETIINLFDKYSDDAPIEKMIGVLDNMKIEIDRIISFDVKQIAIEYSNLINEVINGKITFTSMIENLSIILKKISEEVAFQTISWIKNNNLVIPENYLPKIPKYFDGQNLI